VPDDGVPDDGVVDGRGVLDDDGLAGSGVPWAPAAAGSRMLSIGMVSCSASR